LAGAYLVGVVLIYQWWPPGGGGEGGGLSAELSQDALWLRGVLLGSLLVWIGGLLDDRLDLPPRTQFAFQIAAAFVASWHTVFLERFSNPLHPLFPALDPIVVLPTWLAWLVTTFWIVGLMNAVNWLDGVDGLAAGVGMIAALIFGWHAWRIGQLTVAAFPVALAGALAGFLWFNFPPARLFLGSAGVYLLGYNLATLAFLGPAKMATALLVLALPLLDGVWRIVDRLRSGRSPLSGDRGHLHFRLVDRGWSSRQIVLLYYGIAGGFGFVAIFAPSGLIKLVILALAALAVLLWLARIR
jgi:UDP-GlcNAc:undecaprenyl-phosphate GlcNAc-1-phosphate transferase